MYFSAPWIELTEQVSALQTIAALSGVSSGDPVLSVIVAVTFVPGHTGMRLAVAASAPGAWMLPQMRCETFWLLFGLLLFPIVKTQVLGHICSQAVGAGVAVAVAVGVAVAVAVGVAVAVAVGVTIAVAVGV